MDNIADNIDFYDRRGFDTWVKSLSDERVFCDELSLTGLSFMYGRHTLVLTNNKMWSTVEMNDPMGLVYLLQECSVRLIYLGQLRFGLLHWSPKLPKPLPTPKPPSFKIIEEYTIDNTPSTSSASAPTPVHVGTELDRPGTITTPVDLSRHDRESLLTHMEVIQHKKTAVEHVETTELPDSSVIDLNDPAPSEPVTCPEDGLVLSNYPWKQTLQVKVHKLSALDADIWCGNIPGYYQYVPDPDPDTLQLNPKPVRGYGSKNQGTTPTQKTVKTEVKQEIPDEDPVEQEPAKLIKHANALICGMRSLATDPVGKKKSSKSKRKLRNTAVPVETGVPSALEQLHNSTMDKLAMLGKPDTVDQPKPRTIHCKMCTDSFTSVRELNLHHKQDHGVVKCEVCSKAFSTQSSLDKHKYTHKELPFVCDACGDKFPFQSRLDQHMIKHIPNKLQCPVKSCSKSFKGQGDLNRHIRTHKKGGWHHCDHCDYKNKDKRNVSSHMRVHLPEGDEPYECAKCDKRFHFGTQYRHHLKLGCQV